MSNFCDFCECENCKFGTKYIYHAPVACNKWICDVCYNYDQCTSGPNRNPSGPCLDKTCVHRPTLIGPWIPFSKS